MLLIELLPISAIIWNMQQDKLTSLAWPSALEIAHQGPLLWAVLWLTTAGKAAWYQPLDLVCFNRKHVCTTWNLTIALPGFCHGHCGPFTSEYTHTHKQSGSGTCGLLLQGLTSQDVQCKKHGRVGDKWTCLFKNKINKWHIHTFGSQKQGRSINNFPCTFVTSRWHVVILWWDFEVTCSFKTWDWNKLLRAEHFLPVVFRVRQAGCRLSCLAPPHQALKKAQLCCSLH